MQLPLDLNTTNDIITNTLDLLLFDLGEANNDTNTISLDVCAVTECFTNDYNYLRETFRCGDFHDQQ